MTSTRFDRFQCNRWHLSWWNRVCAEWIKMQPRCDWPFSIKKPIFTKMNRHYANFYWSWRVQRRKVIFTKHLSSEHFGHFCLKISSKWSLQYNINLIEIVLSFIPCTMINISPDSRYFVFDRKCKCQRDLLVLWWRSRFFISFILSLMNALQKPPLRILFRILLPGMNVAKCLQRHTIWSLFIYSNNIFNPVCQ